MRIRRIFDKNSWLIAVIGAFVMWMLISIVAGGISGKTLLINATQASFIVLLALGQMMVITTGGESVDLSQQYVLTLSAYVQSYFVTVLGLNSFWTILLTLLIGAAIGIINAVITIYIDIPAMITTFAVGYIVYTITLMVSKGSQGVTTQGIMDFASFRMGNVSSLVILAVIITIVLAVLLSQTVYGRELKAIGQNRKAAKLASIKVSRNIIVAYVISAVLGSFVGILLCGFNGGAYLDMGTFYSVTPIAATLIGGTLIQGGKSSAVGTLAGGLMLMLIVTFTVLTHLSIGIQYIIEGVIIVLMMCMTKK